MHFDAVVSFYGSPTPPKKSTTPMLTNRPRHNPSNPTPVNASNPWRVVETGVLSSDCILNFLSDFQAHRFLFQSFYSLIFCTLISFENSLYKFTFDFDCDFDFVLVDYRIVFIHINAG